MDYDFIVIGSGFGGSTAALRLVDKGYSVGVLERGKRFEDSDFPRSNWDLRRYLWMPRLGCFGIQNMSLFREVLVLSGSGVGGGSLIYGNTLFQPGDEFFRAPEWAHLCDWRAELGAHYATARRMLGVRTNPALGFVDEVMKSCADELGQGHTFSPTELAIYFGEPGKTVPDPYFGGEGPARAGCTGCGGCFVGCRHNAKNMLTKNYLYLAEKRGAVVHAEREVVDVRPVSGGYEVVAQRSTARWRKDRQVLRARNVVFAAGVLGTLRLLLRCKHETRSLPKLSGRLGEDVRTNSETLLGVTEPNPSPERDYSRGPAITSMFHLDAHTHVQPCRYPAGSNFMRLLAVPLTDSSNPWLRPFLMLWAIARRPLSFLRIAFMRRWSEGTVIFLVMQSLENKMRLGLGRGLLTLFRRGLRTQMAPGAAPVPSYFPAAQALARRFASKVDGTPLNAINEVAFNIPTTAHILGGCPMGRDASEGVIDVRQQVHGYPGLYVCDGSAIPANLGVNPSLTITAMTERAMALVPAKHVTPSLGQQAEQRRLDGL